MKSRASGAKRLALCLGLVLLQGTHAAQGGVARAQERLALDDFRGALEALEAEPDAALRYDGLAELHFRASDPVAALAAAEAGLDEAPDHLNLRFRAATSALWLGAGKRAGAHLEALQGALDGAGLSTDDRAAWDRAVGDVAAEAERLTALESARAAAVQRARWLSWIGLGGLSGGLLWALLAPLARRGPAPAGRP